MTKEIYVEYKWNLADENELNGVIDKLDSIGIKCYSSSFHHKCSCLDIIDFDFIEFSFAFLEQCLVNGTYDLIISLLTRLWNAIRKQKKSDLPFSIAINGVPTSDGSNDISTKIYGDLSDSQKELFIKESFALAKTIADNTMKLKGGKINDRYIFIANNLTCEFKELDMNEINID